MRYPFDGEYPVTSPFGMRASGMHYGIDFGCPVGTPVVAVDDGEVFYTELEYAGGNHLAMYLDHPPVPEAPKAGYMHLERFAVLPGTRVREGDVVGWSDTTGHGLTGPHLHFWIGSNANTGAIDPAPFLGGAAPEPAAPVDSMLALDSVSFGQSVPSVGELIEARVAAILFYSRVSTPPPAYLDECIAAGIGCCPIFETAGLRPYDGYGAGVADGIEAAGDLDGIGVPDGVRCFVNMADTPVATDHETEITEYARGFAETFPGKWLLGSYGPLAALRASQAGSGRFDALWAVETWGAPVGSVEDHWRFWNGQPDVALVQMANVPPPIGGTDTNWIIDRAALRAWGDTEAPLPPKKKRIPMSLTINRVDDGRQELWDANLKIKNLPGDIAYGFTPQAAALAAQGVPVVDWTKAEWEAWYPHNMAEPRP